MYQQGNWGWFSFHNPKSKILSAITIILITLKSPSGHNIIAVVSGLEDWRLEVSM